MPRPRRSTLEAWLDQFSDWPAEEQESALDVAAMIHRQTKRRESRKTEAPYQTELERSTEAQ